MRRDREGAPEARRAHVVGAGLAGLSAATALAAAGWRVTLSEAARHAGGRARSYHDAQLGLTIDNGNHLVLSGNAGVGRYLARIGATDRLAGPAAAAFPFVDLHDGRRWTLRPNAGRLPWWVLAPGRRVPGTRPRDYLAFARLLRAGGDATIGETVPADGALWERLVAPLMISALNTPAQEGSAALAGAIVRETLARGGRACRPLVTEPGLGAAFVEPALAWLAGRGGAVRLGRRLRGLAIEGGRVAALDFTDGRETPAEEDAIVLAVPAWVAAELIPGLTVPTAHHAIVNGHFAVAPPAGTAAVTGLVGGTAEWLFAFPDRLSTTTSAADRLCDADREELARTLWAEVAQALALPPALPRWQIVRERRATFAATPAQERLRPAADIGLANAFLAGDWTATGLPATIEGALRSGETAAALARGRR